VSRGRVLGVDLGSRRIGVAISDDRRLVASALEVLPRGTSHAEDHARLSGLVHETGANLVVVGWPLSLSGGPGPAARAVGEELAELEAALGVPVQRCDERYTTVIAQRALAAGGAKATRRRQARREVVDKVAAEAILQTWLDRERAAPAGAEAGPTAQFL
jgi:putative Holliday junction resolvase